MVARPFGALLTAMATPFRDDGGLDVEAAAALAEHLVDAGTEGLVVNGTTGESPTTTDEEKRRVVQVVVEAVGDRAHVVAGVGTNDTAHSCHLAREAAAAGAHGLLLVSPYYSRPSQAGLIAHVTTVADGTGLPVMLYDIPGRTAVAFATETLLRLGEHPRVVAVKDAKGDLQAATRVMRGSDLAVYSGDDGLTLPYLAVGGVGVVGVTTHLAAPAYARLVAAHDAGDTATARAEHHALQPLVDAVMTRMQGAVAVKAALHALGHLPSPAVRLPLVVPDETERAGLVSALGDAGLL
ncbi:4-hydroxy-tetrahydrodipicolinate synthase [Aquipuribacter nitratireducens]|uniref:4-hydroxy-tetrahydrodipicolinate synthase n=1 Tax=Aquipuribacter nitratireducens TaxID=650104 RepID=A0ABW0GJ15_9MICO